MVKLRSKKINDNKYSLYLDIYWNKKRSYQFLNMHISKSKKDDKEILRIAENIRAKRELELLSGQFGILPEFKKKRTLSEYFEIANTAKKRRSQLMAKSCLNYINRFTENVMLHEIDEQWIKGFEQYLSKYLSHNSVVNYMNVLKIVLYQAVKDKMINNNPFIYYLWGMDQIGHMNSDTTKYFYLKDHLGSIRSILNNTNTVISAQDYDVWGQTQLERSYSNTSMRYDYTGKERDNESNYDYFGARYYDSRVANWTGIDPLFEKHFQWSPYNYVLRNPQKFIDPDGKQVEVIGGVVVVTALAASASLIYGTYKLAEILSDIYIQSQTTEISTEITQEKVEIVDDPSITNPNLETRNKVVKKGIEGAVGQIIQHLDKISGSSPNSGDPNEWKDKWKKDIIKQIKNIKKAADKLKKDPKKVIEELIQKGKLDKDRIIKAGEELKKIGIDFLN